MGAQDLELIERYLQGTLTEAEHDKFKARMLTDSDFAEEVEQHALFQESLELYAERSILKKQIDHFHQEMVSTGKKHGPKQRGPVKRFFIRHYATIAVAASVAIVAVFGTVLSLEHMRSFEKKHYATYKELKLDLEQIKRSQKQIVKDIYNNTKPKAEPSFGGTGFAISPEGYIITSFHIIKGADSLYVENERFDVLKAKVLQTDPANDLALLMICDTNFTVLSNIPYTLSNSNSDLGEKIFILGYPKEDIVYGEGYISSSSGYHGDTASYQVSVPVNPGNSGSPMLDSHGNVIGMIKGKHMQSEGASYALKSHYIISLINSVAQDSSRAPLKLPKKNTLVGQSRPGQIKKMKDYVFVVKVYKE